MSTDKKKPMTLQELSDRFLALLAEGVPGTAEMRMEGCDCYGGSGDCDTGDVSVDRFGVRLHRALEDK